MTVLRLALVLLATFALSVSFAIPAEDVLETAYDESEVLAYESTPSFSLVHQQSALAPSWEVPLRLRREAKDKMHAERSDCEAHTVCDSVDIVDQSFRC